MSYTVIIPARYSSSRLPGKPLLDICGKPMIARVVEKALLSGASQVIIATDNERIVQSCSNLGVKCCMTSVKHNSGTERIAEVIDQLQIADDEIVVNVQGDEPLIPPTNIAQVANLLATSDAPMATLCAKVSGEEVFNPNCVKVIMNHKHEAIYFSRAPIPYERNNFRSGNMEAKTGHARHIGIYAYRAGFVKQYVAYDPCPLEEMESLEQLRVLYYGGKIMVDFAKEDPLVGVDTAEDLERVRAIVAKLEQQ